MYEQVASDNNNNEFEIDLVEIFNLLWKKAWLIILCFVLGASIAGAYTQITVTPVYQARSIIYIYNKTASISSISADLSLSSQLTQDYIILGTTRPVLEQVIEEVGLDISYENLSELVSITNPTDTRFLYITVEHTDPNIAAQISNSLSSVLSERVEMVMGTDQPSTVEQAVVPTIATNTTTITNTIVGGLIGAILVCGIILLRYLLNDTVNTSEDVKRYFGLDTLAVMPFEKNYNRTFSNKNVKGYKKKK